VNYAMPSPPAASGMASANGENAARSARAPLKNGAALHRERVQNSHRHSWACSDYLKSPYKTGPFVLMEKMPHRGDVQVQPRSAEH
jgi:hypothetical protein